MAQGASPESLHIDLLYVGPTPLELTVLAVILVLTVWAWWRFVHA